MFIHSDDFDMSIVLLLIILVGVPLLLRIVAGRYSTRKWGPNIGGSGGDPAPGPMKLFKGLLTVSVVFMPIMLWGPISSASEKQIVVIEGIDDEQLALTRSHYIEKDAVFGLLGILGVFGQVSDTPPGKSGPVGSAAGLPEDLADPIDRSGKRDLLINLSERPLTHWRVAYAADGVTPSPPIAAKIAHGATFSAPSKRLHAGCVDPPPHMIRVKGDREVWVIRRKATLRGERFPTVGWLSWPGLGACVGETLGAPAG